MNDRELLERAAKAAGINLHSAVPWPGTGFYLHAGIDEAHDRWNPLEDDGDAFRLAVDLGIGVDPDAVDATVAFSDNIKWQVVETHGGDKRAATRRAIVRVAAGDTE